MLHQQEDQGKDNLIFDVLNENPIYFLKDIFKDKLDFINNLLPYSIGIEIECFQKNTFDIEKFKNIPYIIEVKCDTFEQRFRIPNGLRGLICLYFISEQLKFNSELNLGSGIHYHVDLSQTFYLIDKDIRCYKWILNDLEIWKYDGLYNTKQVAFDSKGSWVNFRKYLNTIEIRIGEMTFDYTLLLKRILHCTDIVRKINSKFKYTYIYGTVDITLIDNYCKKNYYKINNNVKSLVSLLATFDKKEEIIETIDYNKLIQTREIKCY